jgi:hypothetical protein
LAAAKTDWVAGSLPETANIRSEKIFTGVFSLDNKWLATFKFMATLFRKKWG